MEKVNWYDKDGLREAAMGNGSVAGMLRHLGLVPKGSNYKTLKKWCKYHGIEIPRPASTVGATIPLDEVMVEGSTYSTGSLKRRLLNQSLLEDKCEHCGLRKEWNGKPVVLHLDHINGVSNDHRLKNLRMLCPNCHSQTPTYAGKRKGNQCKRCQVRVGPTSEHCNSCSAFMRHGQKTKIDWPSVKDLLQMLEESNYVQVGKKLGVSDNAIRKRIKNHASVAESA